VRSELESLGIDSTRTQQKLSTSMMLCYAMLCYDMLCYDMLCYAMLCYAMLC
jgi:hypothetical protein